jgi:hypothetical protein
MENDPLEIEIDILEYAERGEEVPHAKAYHVRIDGERYRIDTHDPKGMALLELVGKRPCGFELIEEFCNHENNVVEPDETVNLRKHGLKGFITAHKEIVAIFFDGERHVERGKHTVGEILALPGSGQTVETYDLYLEVPGQGLELLNSAEPVTICGCETFKSQVKSGGSS